MTNTKYVYDYGTLVQKIDMFWQVFEDPNASDPSHSLLSKV